MTEHTQTDETCIDVQARYLKHMTEAYLTQAQHIVEQGR